MSVPIWSCHPLHLSSSLDSAVSGVGLFTIWSSVSGTVHAVCWMHSCQSCPCAGPLDYQSSITPALTVGWECAFIMRNNNNHHCTKCIIFTSSLNHGGNYREIITVIISIFVDEKNGDFERVSCPISIWPGTHFIRSWPLYFGALFYVCPHLPPHRGVLCNCWHNSIDGVGRCLLNGSDGKMSACFVGTLSHRNMYNWWRIFAGPKCLEYILS